MLTQGSRQPSYIAWLIWLRVRHRTNGAVDAVGFWTGPQDQTFTVGGQSRVYAASAILEVEPFTYIAGVDNIQSQTLKLNGVDDQVEQAIRMYDARQAEIEVHMLERPVDLPTAVPSIQRVFKGRVDRVRFERDASDLNGSGATTQTCTVDLMSSDRQGTRVLHLRKSDATQRRVDPNDAGRSYSKSKAKVTWMGETADPHRWNNGKGGTNNAMRQKELQERRAQQP